MRILTNKLTLERIALKNNEPTYVRNTWLDNVNNKMEGEQPKLQTFRKIEFDSTINFPKNFNSYNGFDYVIISRLFKCQPSNIPYMYCIKRKNNFVYITIQFLSREHEFAYRREERKLLKICSHNNTVTITTHSNY